MTELDFTYNDGGRTAAEYSGSTGDCVTRAIAIATGEDYETIRRHLMTATADFRSASRSRAANRLASNSVFRGVSSRIYKPFLASLGWNFISCQKVGHPSTIRMIQEHLPRGIVIIRLRKHLVTVIDHVVHDTCRSHIRAEWVRMPNGAFLIDQGVQVPRTVYGYWTHPDHTRSANRNIDL